MTELKRGRLEVLERVNGVVNKLDTKQIETVHTEKRSLFFAYIIAFIFLFFSGSLSAVQLVNVDIGDAGTASNLYSGPGPAVGSAGDVWNEFKIAAGWAPAPDIMANLVDQTGTPTAVSITFSNSVFRNLYDSAWGGSFGALVGDCAQLWGTETITISGLTPDGEYDLYLFGGKWDNASTFTVGGVSKTIQVAGSAQDPWQEGQEYAVFSGVTADGTGSIVISLEIPAGDPQGDTWISGLQLVLDPPPPVLEHLTAMSFWEVHQPEEIGTWCNYYNGWQLDHCIDARARGMQSLLYIANVFFVEKWDPGWAGFELRTDYQQCWKACKDLVQSLYDSDYIDGFMMPDEAVWTGISISELTTAANAIKADFSDSLIYYNEALAVWVYGKNLLDEPISYTAIPNAVDWISAGWYGNISLVQSHYQNDLYPAMTASQRAILVPDAFGSNNNPNKTLSQYETEMVSWAQQYFNWAKQDSNIVGIIPWHYGTRAYEGSYFEVGVEDMPSVKTKWQEIAADITSNYTWPKKAWQKPVQKFDLFSNDEQLPSTYAWDPWNANPTTPVPPTTSEVAFSTDKQYSGSTSIKMKTSSSKFRYCWGTNDRNLNRTWGWTDDPVQNIEFQVYVDPGINLYIYPYHESDYTCYFFITSAGQGGLAYHDSTGYYYVCNILDFNINAWNKVGLTIDTDTDNLKIYLNGEKLYDGNFVKIDDVSMTTVGFANWGTPRWLDDIAIWSGNRRNTTPDVCSLDLNSDGSVNLYEFTILASDWLIQGPFEQADFTGNDTVDIDDLTTLASFWLSQCSP